jgi:hypothetical protein
MHVGACTALCLSCDGSVAASAGDDGTIFIISLLGLKAAANSLSLPKEGNGDVVMINRQELNLGLEQQRELMEKNAALELQIAEDAARVQLEMREMLNAAKAKDQAEIQALRLRYETLQQDATAKERETLRQMKAKEAHHVQIVDEKEAEFDKKVQREAGSFAVLNNEMGQLEVQLRAVLAESERQLDLLRQRQQVELSRRVAEKDQEVHKLKEVLAFTQHRFNIMLDEEGMEQDLELNELNRQCQAEIEQQRVVEYKLKKDQDTLLRALEMMEKDREQAGKLQAETFLSKVTIMKQLEELQQTVNTLKEERSERERALREKELEIGAFKVKVNTLHKFKRVLDFRFREVKHSLIPKDKTIAKLNAELRRLEAEFERQLTVQRDMEIVLETKKGKIVKLSAEGERLRELVKKRDRKIDRFTSDLDALVQNEQDLRLWPRGLKTIYDEHVDPRNIIKDEDTSAMQEVQRQIAVMERKVKSLSAHGRSTEALCSSSIQKETRDNSMLIKELNEIRSEQKFLQKRTKELELKVRQAETKLANKREEREAAAALALAEGSSTSSDRARLGNADIDGFFGAGAYDPNVSAVRVGLKPHRRANVRPEPVARSQPMTTLVARPKSRGAMAEERKAKQRLLLDVDHAERAAQQKALENKLLRDQLKKLQLEKEDLDDEYAARYQDRTTKPSAAAGTGLAAVRASTHS